MSGTLITHLQIFGIGFSFGLAGPCLLTCAPVLITYIAGTDKRFIESLKDITVFLTGRLAAYCVLGYAAGLSASFLNRLIQPQAASFFRPAAGVVSIILGIAVFFSGYIKRSECFKPSDKIYGFTGLFVLGFALGAAPCAPLAALLFEIALISKSGLDGASYALSFGIGTFLSGFIVVGVMAGIISRIPAKLLRSGVSVFVFKTACSALLITLGLRLIWYRFQ